MLNNYIHLGKGNPEEIKLWGGIESTFNRLDNEYFDQLEMSGHYFREDDLDYFTQLGIEKLRYPVLFEKYMPVNAANITFGNLPENLFRLKNNGIDPIIGLIHHGSGPMHSNILSDSFADRFKKYAQEVAKEFPFVDYFTPVNEPLTTARFCGLYGHWHPHHRSDKSFFRILINQLKAVVLSMQEIRKINPRAKLIQTEDLGKVYSTPVMKYQADFENHRRWLTFDLLNGIVDKHHPLYDYIINAGISDRELEYFAENPCKPDIAGANYYVTSERFLDENLFAYPAQSHSSNNIHQYADVEVVRVKTDRETGIKSLLRELWERYNTPIAVTELHISCHREEQLRWWKDILDQCKELKKSSTDIQAVTAWSLLGSYGWDRLLTSEEFKYETGVYDVSSGYLRETALTKMLKDLNTTGTYSHPVLKNPGWWKRDSRFYNNTNGENIKKKFLFIKNNKKRSNPDERERKIFIVGKRGTLGSMFIKHCNERSISCIGLGKDEFDLCNTFLMETLIKIYRPWAIINCAGYVNVDKAESDRGNCFMVNSYGSARLAYLCTMHDVKLVTFSTDMVFDGIYNFGYSENSRTNPVNLYGLSKVLAEKSISMLNPDALVVRTSSFFSPYDDHNFLKTIFQSTFEEKYISAANDVCMSPTYVPHLVNAVLDLLIDDMKGIVHLVNNGTITWDEFAKLALEMAGMDTKFIIGKNVESMNLPAKRPANSSLKSTRGKFLPDLEEGLLDFLDHYRNLHKGIQKVNLK